MQRIIPMTKATGLRPMPNMLEEHVSGKALQRVFRRENVPMEVIENREVRIPLVSMMGLFDNAAREAGSRTFGYSAGNDMSHENFGMWLVYAASAPSLGEALRRATITARFQQSGSKLVVIRSGAYAILRNVVPAQSEVSVQHADHILGPMTKFIQSFLGARWRPEWVELNYQRDAEAHLLERELQSTVRFSSPGVGVAIRLDQLDLPNRRIHSPALRGPLTLLDVEASEMVNRFDEPVRSLYSIVILRLLDGQADVEGAAQMAGLGVQGLQRLLRREGLTYRGLVDAAKRGKACALLKESTQNITEIAFGLGYSDHANFTRAFTRWLDCSPSDYRKAMIVQGNGSDSTRLI